MLDPDEGGMQPGRAGNGALTVPMLRELPSEMVRPSPVHTETKRTLNSPLISFIPGQFLHLPICASHFCNNAPRSRREHLGMAEMTMTTTIE